MTRVGNQWYCNVTNAWEKRVGKELTINSPHTSTVVLFMDNVELFSTM